ncbi:hypothetical protein D0O17_23570 [Salmonella enterica]|nr:hypothetical protein [Salmonella enterica]
MKKTPPAALGMLLIQTGGNNDFNISSYCIVNNDNGHMVSSTQRKKDRPKIPGRKNLTILPQQLPPSVTGTHVAVSNPIQHGLNPQVTRICRITSVIRQVSVR